MVQRYIFLFNSPKIDFKIFLYRKPRDSCESRGFLLFVVTDTDKVPWWAEGCPGDVEPTVAGQKLVGQGIDLQECDQALELLRVFGADVGSLALEVLGGADATNLSVDPTVAEARVNDDGTADGLAGGFQQVAAAVDHVGNLLYGRDVVGVLVEVAELGQREVITEFDVFH